LLRHLLFNLLRAALVVVIVLMGLERLLPELLLALVDIRIKLVAVLSNRELLVVVDRDDDFACANRLIISVVKLGHVWVSQSLFRSQTLIRIEL
jgi:hypothetical protein